jgi:hypothetical protein
VLKLAALVILRLYNSSYAIFLDHTEVDHYFDMALNLHRSMIVDKNDFHERATILLPDLRRIFRQDAALLSSEPSLKVRTRQSASVLHDSHWIWRDYYASRSLDTQRLGRPPRELPSLVQYSPSSGPATGGTISHAQTADEPERKRSENSHIAVMGPAASSSGQLQDQSSSHNALSESQHQQAGSDDLPLDPLEMMYAFLDPCDESSALFYPSWTVDEEVT